MRAVDVIRTKRDGGILTATEWRSFVAGAVEGTWEPYQLSAMLMAITLRGLIDPETADLTRAMADSGTRLDLGDLPGVKADKHSTGGVGDKTSLVVAPLAAACGVVVPMMSGRGLGHTGGTLDKLEAIPGFRANLTAGEFRKVLKKVGVAIASTTAEVAPADRALYALRDVTATVESIPLITASILSKKLAEGVSGLVLDVKCGRGAFMKHLPDARKLALSLIRVGTLNGLKVEAVITAMDAPLGHEVGNANEVSESIGVLEGKVKGPLAELSLLLAAKLVKLAGLAKTDAAAMKQVKQALEVGAGLTKFMQLVAAQGGDLKAFARLKPHTAAEVLAVRDGRVTGLDAELVGRAAVLLGAGRARTADAVDPLAGVTIPKPTPLVLEVVTP
jgi:pyrimidine-nucleoside phosphorylase